MLNQNKLEKLENRKNLLVRNIQLCKNYKERTIRFVQRLNNQYSLGLISHEEHYSRLSNALKQRTPEQWTKYFDDYARYYEYQLSKCEKEIRKEGLEARDINKIYLLITNTDSLEVIPYRISVKA